MIFLISAGFPFNDVEDLANWARWIKFCVLLPYDDKNMKKVDDSE